MIVLKLISHYKVVKWRKQSLCLFFDGVHVHVLGVV